MSTKWFSFIEDTCKEIKTDYIDVIIDQAGLDFTVIPALNNLSIVWLSLYKGMPEEIIVDDAPLIIRVNVNDASQKQWLINILAEIQPQAPALILCSLWPFSLLAEWLSCCTDAANEGRPGVFRFYDPRIFSVLFSSVLNENQQYQLLRPVLFWSWLDRDSKPQMAIGNGTPPAKGEQCQKIDLDDRHYEYLMCVCDVVNLLNHRVIPESYFSSKEQRFQQCFSSMMAATDAGIILDDERENWVMEKLTSDLQVNN